MTKMAIIKTNKTKRRSIATAQKRYRQKRFSRIKKKVLLMLATGIGLAFASTPRQYFKVASETKKQWQFTRSNQLKEIIDEFRYDRLIDFESMPDGSTKVVIAKQGKLKALQFNLEKMKIKPTPWDGYWKMVIFDIPESKKNARNALRDKLKELGFIELQKSVFLHRFECRDEIDFLMEVFDIRPFVRYGLVNNLTNEEEIKRRFS